MRSIARVLLAATLVTGMWASTAQAANGDCRLIRGADTPTDPTDDVSVCRQDVWFHQADTRLGNLSGAGADTSPTWDTTKPTGSFPQAGAAYAALSEYDIFVSQDPLGRAIWEGKFTGALDTLGFQVYLRSPFYDAAGGPYESEVYLAIDGAVINDNFDTASIDITRHAAGNFDRIDAAFLNVYDAMSAAGLDLSPTATHTVQLGLVDWFFPGTETVFFYDTAETPSGLIFNLERDSMAGFTTIDLAAQL